MYVCAWIRSFESADSLNLLSAKRKVRLNGAWMTSIEKTKKKSSGKKCNTQVTEPLESIIADQHFTRYVSSKEKFLF